MNPARPRAEPTPSLPVRVLFLHLDKTGGTTLRDVLTRALPGDAVLADDLDPVARAARNRAIHRYLHGDGERPPDRGNRAILARWAAAGADLDRARIYSAHLRFGMHEHLPAPSTYVTIVRDPVARLRSLYRHRVAHQELEQTPAEWIGSGRDEQLDNFQTRVLAGEATEGLVGPCTAATLDRAKEHLVTHFAAVGVTERYDESVVAILTALGLSMVPVRRLNASSPTAERGPFTAELDQWLADHNRYDTALHRFVAGRLDDMLSTIDAARELRRLRRISRADARRRQLREWAYPTRRRLGLLRRALTGLLPR